MHVLPSTAFPCLFNGVHWGNSVGVWGEVHVCSKENKEEEIQVFEK